MSRIRWAQQYHGRGGYRPPRGRQAFRLGKRAGEGSSQLDLSLPPHSPRLRLELQVQTSRAQVLPYGEAGLSVAVAEVAEVNGARALIGDRTQGGVHGIRAARRAIDDELPYFSSVGSIQWHGRL